MTPKTKAVLIVLLIASVIVGGTVAAAVILTSNHIEHPDPLPSPSLSASPTPSPTPSPSPTPTTSPVPTVVTLTANDTDIHYNDKITFTAQLNQPVAGITITYYNNGTNYGTYTTDAAGTATFTRGPFTGAYDIHVTATIP